MKHSIQDLTIQVKKACRDKGLSQMALSQKTGLPQSHISKIEQGKIDLQLSSFIEIARILDLEVVLISKNDMRLFQGLKSWELGSQNLPAFQLSEGGKQLSRKRESFIVRL